MRMWLGNDEYLEVGGIMIHTQPLTPLLLGVLKSVNPEILMELDPYLDYVYEEDVTEVIETSEEVTDE